MTQPDRSIEQQRTRLTALAFRMLATTSEAEDAVQDAFVRWYRMSDAERAAVLNPPAWLTRVTSRICLDMLGSARQRREHYVGPWLPEPLPEQAWLATGGDKHSTVDPAERAALNDSVSTALLVVLEKMTPAERVVFVLHDVFAVPFGEIAAVVERSPASVRKLATSARQRVESGRHREVPRAEHDAVVRDFATACRNGDVEALMATLNESVTLHTDGGGRARAAIRSIAGADRVARFLIGVIDKRDDAFQLRRSGDGLCLVAQSTNGLFSVANFLVAEGQVEEIWMMVNPDKLTHWKRTIELVG